MVRKASAVWKGSLKEGKGTISSDSGVLSNTPYSFSTRFENAKGTNPEELIAAAHAGCFTMALSAQLGNAGITPESLETTASLTLDKLDAGWTVTKIHLDVAARIPGADKAAFMADSQVPWGVGALDGSITDPAWRIKPSWYLVATDDRMIPPPAQRAMSERAGSTVIEVPGSHAIYVSQPAAVAALIHEAATAVSTRQ